MKYNTSIDIYLDDEHDYAKYNKFIRLIKELSGDNFDMDTIKEML